MIYRLNESVAWTRPLTAVKLSSLHPLLHLHSHHSCRFVFHSLTSCSQPKSPQLPLPTLRFGPQRWRADSYNYPSVCEMNHWVADWAAWWETSILSGTTLCSGFSIVSLPMPGAGTHKLRKGGCGPVCAEADAVWQSYVFITEHTQNSAEMCWNWETRWCNVAWWDATCVSHKRQSFKEKLRAVH